MKQLPTFLLLLLSLSSLGQVNYIKGDGIISVDLERFPTIELFAKTTDSTPIHTITVFDDTEIKSFNIKNLEAIEKEWFFPMHLHLDYYIFYFQCSAIEENWFQIIVNEKTNLKYWVKKSTDFEYIKWEDFIIEVTSVKPIKSDENPIRQAPDINSKLTDHQLIDCLTPVEIIGDWMKIKVEPAVCDMTFEMEGKEFSEGYIKWRDGNELLIYYWLLL